MMASMPAAIASTRDSSSSRRSSMLGASRRSSAARISSAFAARISFVPERIRAAALARAAFLRSLPAAVNEPTAWRALRPSPVINAATSMCLSAFTVIAKQYQFVTVNHDCAASIAEHILNLRGFTARNTGRLVRGILGKPATQLVAIGIFQMHDVTAIEVAGNGLSCQPATGCRRRAAHWQPRRPHAPCR